MLDDIDHNLAAPPEDPQCHLPLFGERDLGDERRCQEAHDETA
jgi:hypothetical protein